MPIQPFNKRFRGFLPIVIDVETAGFEPKTDALLEIAAFSVVPSPNENKIIVEEHFHEHVAPFPGAHLDAQALEFNQIIPDHPLRFAVSEEQALNKLFHWTEKKLTLYQCRRAVLVGHNAFFDLGFIKAASDRCQLNMPFHRFTSFDTASLAGLVYGQTVLARACRAARIHFEQNEAHSALYDAKKTAELFCNIVNKWESRITT